MPPNMPPQGPPAAKKTSVWVWILGGVAVFLFAITLTCGVIGYLGVRMIKNAGFDSDLMKKNPGLAMAKMVTAMNKDYETVSTNDATGTIVVREISTGKKITMKFDPDTKKMVVTNEDGKQGSVSFDSNGMTAQSADGTLKVGGAAANNVPAWVPVYPGSSPQGTFSSSNSEGSQNTFSFKSADPADKILAYYNDAFKTGGFKINMTTTTGTGGLVQAGDEANKRTIQVFVSNSPEGTTTAITAIEKK